MDSRQEFLKLQKFLLKSKIEEDLGGSGEEINQSHALGFESNEKVKASSAGSNVTTKPNQTES